MKYDATNWQEMAVDRIISVLEETVDNYNYPEGADTKDAPWNQDEGECHKCAAAELQDAFLDFLDQWVCPVSGRNVPDRHRVALARMTDDVLGHADPDLPCRKHR